MQKNIKETNNYNELIHRGLHIKASTIGTLGFCTRWAVNKHGLRHEWIEIVEKPLAVKKLPSKLRGLRIAHISDLHYGRTVSGAYLARCIKRLNSLNADIVVITGDLITYDIRGRFRKKVTNLLGKIKSPLGVYACLGNHDYGIRSHKEPKRLDLFGQLITAMKANGVKVLRNESTILDVNGCPLWLVGLGDLWEGDFEPPKAFAHVPKNQTSIVLMHNPRGAEYLGQFPGDVIVSGHTHGGKIRISAIPSISVKNRRFYAGMYDVDGRTLYVNRGLGRVGRPRINARPEITVLTLC